MVLEYEDFYELVNEYLSDVVVDNKFKESNEDLFRELIFDFYNMYIKKIIVDAYGEVVFNPFDALTTARMIEKVVNNLKRFGYN